MENKLSKEEMNVLSLVNSQLKDKFIEYASNYLKYIENDVSKIVSKLLSEGYIEIVKLPQGERMIEWYFYTKKVTRDLLNDDVLYDVQLKGGETIAKANKALRTFQSDKNKKFTKIKLD